MLVETIFVHFIGIFMGCCVDEMGVFCFSVYSDMVCGQMRENEEKLKKIEISLYK